MDPIIPTIGRIVLYRGKDKRIRPAMVTEEHGAHCVDLYVFPKNKDDEEDGNHINVTHADPADEPGCFPSWHWMPYQKQQHAAGTSVHAAPQAPAPAPAGTFQPTNTVTKAQIDALIAKGQMVQTKLGDKTAVVMVTLANGFEITETAACVDAKNFDAAMGLKICMEKIVNRLWALEGYRLQCELAKV